MIQGWTVYVVDAHSLIFQVFHALPEMTSSRGEQVGAVYGFTRDILYLIEQKKPDALICAFDSPGPTFRHDLFADYKADRGEMPEELVTQIPKIQQVLEALAIPVIAKVGYEADDILATIARICDEQAARCLLVTGDKDCRQLITDHVAVYNIRKDQEIDAAVLQSEWGITPRQVVDFQSLVGDKVDNIPGVPLIGPKIAGELLGSYGTLEAILDNTDKVKGAKRSQNLKESRDLALLSRQLVRLDANVPLEIDWNACRLEGFDPQKLAELSDEFGFRSLGLRLQGLAPVQPPAVKGIAFHIVDSFDALEKLAARLAEQKVISVDTETTHVWPRWAELVGLSFAFEIGEAFYVPICGPETERCLDARRTLETLRPVLENPNIAKIGQNLKYDVIVLRAAGVELAGIAFDTMIASYLLDAGSRSHNLTELAKRYLNQATTDIEELIGRGKQQTTMDKVPIEQVARYAADDAEIPLRLYPLLQRRLEEESLDELNGTLEVPLISVLADLEFIGIRIDPSRLDELSQRYDKRLEVLEKEIEELAGHPLNINSPKQLAQVLFDELRLPVVKKSKTGPSTDADVLEELAPLHPLPAKIVEYRQYTKLKGTYVDALPAMIHPDTQRVHASFNQVVAATGRLSSHDPNLQNIPIRTEEGREIRSAFTVGTPAWKLLAADYSQIELRVLAHFSQDAQLCEAFANDEDIHTRVASQVYGVPFHMVTAAQRRSAKAVNFGIIYGQSPFGLARSLGISQDEAAEFIDGYFAQYPGVEQFMSQTLATCREQGFVTTIRGRKRAIAGVRAAEFDLFGARRQLNMPERTAVNTVIQGSAADIMKMAMLDVRRRLREDRLQANMLLQIHDELVFEVEPAHIGPLADMVQDAMRSVMPLRVPLKVDVKYGDNWAECEPWTTMDGLPQPQFSEPDV